MKKKALRVAYVAATRARDLLVVTAIGEEDRQGGWLSPLHDALYPPKDRWRVSGQRPGLPASSAAPPFSTARPTSPTKCRSTPGCTIPEAGSHTVVWFDPAVLALRAPKPKAWRTSRCSSGTTEQAVEGLRRYRGMEGAGARSASSAGAVARLRSRRRARISEPCEEAAHIPVETVTLPSAARASGRAGNSAAWCTTSCSTPLARGRPGRSRRSGARSMRPAEKSAPPPRKPRARLSSTSPGCIPAGAERHRELPVMVRLEDGTAGGRPHRPGLAGPTRGRWWITRPTGAKSGTSLRCAYTHWPWSAPPACRRAASCSRCSAGCGATVASRAASDKYPNHSQSRPCSFSDRDCCRAIPRCAPEERGPTAVSGGEAARLSGRPDGGHAGGKRTSREGRRYVGGGAFGRPQTRGPGYLCETRHTGAFRDERHRGAAGSRRIGRQLGFRVGRRRQGLLLRAPGALCRRCAYGRRGNHGHDSRICRQHRECADYAAAPAFRSLRARRRD